MNRDLSYVAERYKVPARVGAPVLFEGKPGRVVGASGPHVLIRLDGERLAIPYHPRWHLIWLEENGPATDVPAPPVLPAPTWPAFVLGEPQWSGV